MKRLSAAFIVSALALTACNPHGEARSPTVTEATAPEPTVIVAPVACRGPRPGREGDELVIQFRLLMRTLIKAPEIELDPEQHVVICAALGKTYPANTFVIGDTDIKDWKAGLTVTTVVQDIATAYHAKSVLIPVLATMTSCNRDSAVVRDSQGRTVATVEDSMATCTEGGGAKARAYLLSPDGDLYWKSWTSVLTADPERVEKAARELFANVPAKLVGGSQLDEAPAPESAKPAAAAKGDFEAGAFVEATMNKKSAPACKQYAKWFCENASVLRPQDRPLVCASYIKSLTPIAKMPSGEDRCKTMLDALPREKH